MLLNNQWITEEIKEEIKKYLETNENKTWQSKPYRMQQSSSMRKVYSNTSLPQETRISNKQSDFTPKATKRKKNKQNPKLAEGKKS